MRRNRGRLAASLSLSMILVFALSSLAFASGDGGDGDGTGGGHGRLRVEKVADTDAVLASGEDVTFTYTVHNETDLKFWITDLSDDVFGMLAGDADCQVGTMLPPGGSCSFEHTAWLEGEAGTTHVNTFTASAEHYGWVLSDSATASVAFLPVEVVPTGRIHASKVANDDTARVHGQWITFRYGVHNDTNVPMEIRRLHDDVFGALKGDANCHVGRVLPAGGSCWFPQTEWLAGHWGTEHVNTFTVKAVHGDWARWARATETVRFVGTGAGHGRLAADKVADTDTVPASGQDVTFTYTVHNDTNLKFEILALTDDVFGALAGDDDCMVGVVLPAGGSCSFAITERLQGEAGTDHVNTFTVKAGHYGWVLTATATETVGFVADDDSSALGVEKTADVEQVPATGAEVLFTFVVTNEGETDLTIATLDDDVFGALAGDDDCMVGTVLPAGGSCTFTHSAMLQGAVGDEHVNTVTVTAAAEGSSDVFTATDTESVAYVEVGKVLGRHGSDGTGAAAAVAAGGGGTAFTGGDVVPAAVAGVGLLGLGGALLVAAKRARALS